MASDLEKKAKEAFIDDHFELAVDLYSQAIDSNPSDPELFADRSQAHIKLSNFTEAIADANRAILMDSSMAKAYLRKGIACMRLEEYETAKVAFQQGALLAPDDSRFTNYIKECDKCIAEEQPNLLEPQNSICLGSNTNASNALATNAPQGDGLCGSGTTAATKSKPKFRHEFYQKPEEVVVTIFAKGIRADNVVVDYGEQILSVTIDTSDGEPYHFQPRLYGKIIPSRCRYDVMSTKIEIRLAKAEAIQWTSLEYTKETAVPQRIIVSSNAERPSYPSSKHKGVDWDKLEAQVKKEEKGEKLDGDAALTKFFKDIYQDADEDMRRAMQKSFVESNGTVLSTNWKDVGSKTIEATPPDSMELKKWEY